MLKHQERGWEHFPEHLPGKVTHDQLPESLSGALGPCAQGAWLLSTRPGGLGKGLGAEASKDGDPPTLDKGAPLLSPVASAGSSLEMTGLDRE